MRCPKCGFNSFDYLDSCKKCGKDLSEFKERYGITSILFPGQLNPAAASAEAEFDDASADAAVVAATATAVAAVAAETGHAAAEDISTAAASEADDFGFDFMGDSSDDDDLSFDELFDGVSEDEDVEESLEAPKPKAASPEEDEFAFDMPADDDFDTDFGFDVGEDEESADNADDSGKGPKNPFDLPESAQTARAPENTDKSPSIRAEEQLYSDFYADLTVAGTVAQEVLAEAPGADADAPDGELVSPLMRRALASSCDVAILGVASCCFLVAAESAMGTTRGLVLPSFDSLLDQSVPYFLILFFLCFGYFTLFHFLVGQTPGKMLARLRVESTAGEPLTFAQAFLRTSGGLFLLLPCGLGLVSLFFDRDRRGWNDRLAGTRVVDLDDLAVIDEAAEC